MGVEHNFYENKVESACRQKIKVDTTNRNLSGLRLVVFCDILLLVMI